MARVLERVRSGNEYMSTSERVTAVHGVLVLALCTGGCSGKALTFETGGQAGMAGGEQGGAGGTQPGSAGGAPLGGGGAPLGGGGAGSSGGPTVWLVFDSDGAALNRDIFLTPITGGPRHRLPTSAASDPANETEPSFSPDGAWLAFTSDIADARPQIWAMNLASLTSLKLTNRAGGATHPAFSSDGQRVGFRSGANLYTVALDGSDEQIVKPPPQGGAVPGCGSPLDCDMGGPAFSSDGNWLIYDAYNQIVAQPLDGSDSRVIVPPTTAEQSNPTISKDGATVALQVTCGDGNLSIWAVPFSGISGFPCQSGKLLSVQGEHSAHPSFGPGGEVAWDTGRGDGKLQIWSEGRLRDVTSGPADDRNPTWVPSAALPILGLEGI